MVEKGVKFSLGHRWGLEQAGIIHKDEPGIGFSDLVRRTFEKRAVLAALDNLRMEAANKAQGVYNFDVFMESADIRISKLQSGYLDPEVVAGLIDDAARMDNAIYSATLHIPLLEEASLVIYGRAAAQKVVRKGDKVTARRHLRETSDLRQKTTQIIKESGTLYVASFERIKKISEEYRNILVSRGIDIPDISGI